MTTRKEQELEDQELDIGKLGISRKVSGRHKREGSKRVYYTDRDGVCRIPEKVVLNRWHKKGTTKKGVSHHGHRLPPHTFALLGAIVEYLPENWRVLTADDVEGLVEEAERGGVSLPKGKRSYAAIADLLRLFSDQEIRRLIDRHRIDEDPLGVPDLVLFLKKANGKLTGPRFVEVKKPEEPISKPQRREIQFLRDEMGLRAGVLRLDEVR